MYVIVVGITAVVAVLWKQMIMKLLLSDIKDTTQIHPTNCEHPNIGSIIKIL